MKHLVLTALLACSCLLSTGAAQAPIHFLDSNQLQALGQGLPYVGGFTPAGDFDGDGGDDFWMAVGTRLLVVAASDLSVVLDAPPPLPGWRFVPDFAAVGDVDHDGIGDFVVRIERPINQYSSDYGFACYSGSSATPLWAIPFGAQDPVLALTPVSDLDGDGAGDFAGQYWTTTSHGIRFFSGASGVLLHDAPLWDAWWPVGDFDGDGIGDFALRVEVQFPQFAARIVSGSTWTTLIDIEGPPLVGGFPSSVDAIGDWNGDGIDDIAVSTPYAPHLEIRSTRSADLLATLPIPAVEPGGSMVRDLVVVDDLDGDGVRDFVAEVTGLKPVRAYSGADGRELWAVRVHAYLGPMGVVGDANNDGRDEFAIVLNDISHPLAYLRVIDPASLAPTTFCVGTPTSQGTTPTLFADGGVSTTIGAELQVVGYSTLNQGLGAIAWSTNRNFTPFAGGTLCIGADAVIVFTPPQPSGGSTSGWPSSYSFTFTKSYLAQHGLTAGTTFYAQLLCRDPGLASPNLALSNGIRIELIP